LAVQRLMAKRDATVPQDKRPVFRAGINLGECDRRQRRHFQRRGQFIEARLQEIADPGGICLSQEVCDDPREYWRAASRRQQ
jgi:adenylate cyclase